MAQTTLLSSEVVLLVFKFGSQPCNIIPGGMCVHKNAVGTVFGRKGRDVYEPC